jgi:hypothetical protein
LSANQTNQLWELHSSLSGTTFAVLRPPSILFSVFQGLN